jgi:hypothetical protein
MGEMTSRYGGVAVNILNKQLQTASKGWFISLGVRCGTVNSSLKKNKLVLKCHKGSRTWMDSLDRRPELRKMDMRFGTWIVRSLYMAGLLVKVAKEISKEKLDLK